MLSKATSNVAVFRADASLNIGSGHIVRSVVLAKELQKLGFKCIFACSKESFDLVPQLNDQGMDRIIIENNSSRHFKKKISDKNIFVSILVIDHYELDKDFEVDCKSWSKFVMAIEDKPNREHYVDIILDQTYDRSSKEYKGLVPEFCKIFSGVKYALIDEKFSKNRANVIEQRKLRSFLLPHVLVSMGSSDPNNITSKIIKSISKLNFKLTVDIVLGNNAKNIPEIRDEVNKYDYMNLIVGTTKMHLLMTKADLSIGAGGSTSWERCCLGLPSISIIVADNQVDINNRLSRDGIILNLGWCNELSNESISKALIDLISELRDGSNCHKYYHNICDWSGSKYISKYIYQLINKVDEK